MTANDDQEYRHGYQKDLSRACQEQIKEVNNFINLQK